MAELRFSGQKILVTRPIDQAAHLAKAIKEAGGVPLLFPLLQIEPVENQKKLQEELQKRAEEARKKLEQSGQAPGAPQAAK